MEGTRTGQHSLPALWYTLFLHSTCLTLKGLLTSTVSVPEDLTGTICVVARRWRAGASHGKQSQAAFKGRSVAALYQIKDFLPCHKKQTSQVKYYLISICWKSQYANLEKPHSKIRWEKIWSRPGQLPPEKPGSPIICSPLFFLCLRHGRQHCYRQEHLSAENKTLQLRLTHEEWRERDGSLHCGVSCPSSSGHLLISYLYWDNYAIKSNWPRQLSDPAHPFWPRMECLYTHIHMCVHTRACDKTVHLCIQSLLWPVFTIYLCSINLKYGNMMTTLVTLRKRPLPIKHY